MESVLPTESSTMSLLVMFFEDFPTSVIVVLDLSVGPLVGAVVQVKRKNAKSAATKKKIKRDNGRMKSPLWKKVRHLNPFNHSQKYIPTLFLSVTYVTFCKFFFIRPK